MKNKSFNINNLNNSVGLSDTSGLSRCHTEKLLTGNELISEPGRAQNPVVITDEFARFSRTFGKTHNAFRFSFTFKALCFTGEL